MSFWPHRHRHEVLVAVALLARRGEALPGGLRELGRDDPDLARHSAGLVARLERGEALAPALVAERLLSAADAATLGAEPAGVLDRILTRWSADRAGASLLRWYPLWLVAWWMLPGLLLAALVEGVARKPFPLMWAYSGHDPEWMTPDLAVAAAVLLGGALLISWAIRYRWLQLCGLPLVPGLRRALLARRLLDQAATGTVPAAWWTDRKIWHNSGWSEATQEADPATALIADGLLILGADDRPDWTQSHQRADDDVRRRLGPARALLTFGLVMSGLCGVACFLNAYEMVSLFDYDAVHLTGNRIFDLACLQVGLLVVIMLAQIPIALGRRVLTGWNWNHTWPRLAAQLATALERREDPLLALGNCHLVVPHHLRPHLEEACLELSAGGGDSLMTVLGRHGLVNPPQLPAALAAEQAGPEALVAWLHQEGASAPAISSALTQLQGQLLLCFLIISYLVAFVLPKFQYIFKAVLPGQEAPWSVHLMLAVFSTSWPWLVLVGLLLTGVLLHRRGWWPSQRQALRLHRGDLLVRGLAAGRSEADLAGILAFTWRRPPPALAATGPRGDWNRLLAISGWAAATPATLAEEVDRTRLRLHRSRARTIAISLVLVPILTALPVGVALHSVFASIAILNRSTIEMAGRTEAGTGRYMGVEIGGPRPVMIVPFFRQPLPLGAPSPGATP